MKRNLIVALALAAAAIAALIWWRTRATKPEAKTTATETASAKEQAKDVYYCPMHPSVTSDGPGSCPICGMALVKRAAPAAATAADPSLSAVSLSPEQRVTANVRTMEMHLGTHTGELVTTGRVTFDERRRAQVTSYTQGRIERLYVNFTGDSVRRGQTVASIYSPDLYATQQEYLVALANQQRMRNAGFTDARSASQDLVDSTRRRLMLLGMSQGQISQLERSGKPLYTTSIVAPVSGIVTNKLVVPQQYVAQGQPLLEVADLSTVWVEADVYEQQLPDIRIGQRVTITSPAIPGQEFPGTVSFIQPVLAGQTRTATVRVELANRQLLLKPDMYVSVKVFGTEIPAHMMVPATAVIDRGQKRYVWVETQPGTYEPREVTTGARHGESVVIAAGLHEGEKIVTEGGFLLDSEAQLRGTTAAAAEHAGH